MQTHTRSQRPIICLFPSHFVANFHSKDFSFPSPKHDMWCGSDSQMEMETIKMRIYDDRNRKLNVEFL